MKSIKQLKTGDLSGKKVLVRVDFNVPLIAGQITETFRIEQTLPTINYLREQGAKIILVSHLGDDGTKSLAPVAAYLEKYWPVQLMTEIENPEVISKLTAGAVILLENVRRWPGEKTNDENFARRLASLADVYVNDAFSVSHRAHASIVGVPCFLPSYAGLQFEREVNNLSRLFSPQLPLVVILGGVKFQTKIPLIKKFLTIADKIFIGGALASSFFQAQGYEIGQSVVDREIDYIKPFLNESKIILPPDVIVKTISGQKIKQPTSLENDEIIADIGPASFSVIKEMVTLAKTVLWNGPMGSFEKGDNSGTNEVAKILAKSQAFTVVGGGDTLAAIKNLGLSDKFGFISTGGGAMLEYLAAGTLPGIEALEK